ncbi:eclosion hormone-like [Pararge aegeria]|uniref:eclosion hormone-like n=1 Tax=Pararge aegeria TaxID=116150 RepID=UPI0019D1B966|nr:eclosion hormone-like [Pararge aegeria]
MAAKITTAFALFAVILSFMNLDLVDANPAIATGYDPLQICIENCAQCKKMLGAWFDGSLCAESCLKFRGKMIPECEDFASIASFIHKN